jgi:peroxiredoxin
MNEQKQPKKTSWILIGLIVVAAAGAFMIIQKRSPISGQTSEVAFDPWIGKPAPDFKIVDIQGTEHRLGDYLGKNVMVVFWATWCPTCNIEIPNLIELRKKFTENDLFILAISNEPAELLREFVKTRKINYTVATIGDRDLPRPFADVEVIPISFLIDRSGNFKRIVVGLETMDNVVATLREK